MTVTQDFFEHMVVFSQHEWLGAPDQVCGNMHASESTREREVRYRDVCVYVYIYIYFSMYRHECLDAPDQVCVRLCVCVSVCRCPCGCVCVCVCVTWLICRRAGSYKRCSRDMTHSCMWHDSLIWVQHDSFICVTWLISRVWHDSFVGEQDPTKDVLETWLIYMRDMTHSYVCNMTHTCVWHDSFVSE